MEILKKQSIIDAKVGHIIEKNSVDKVSLIGSYFDKESLYIENLEIIINQENDISEIITKIPYSGYDLQIFLADFNNDGKDEIMIRGKYGGSGGYDIAAIYCFNNGKLIEIFNPDMFSDKYKFTAQYLQNKKVLVTSHITNEYFIYDISNKPEEYLNMIYNEKGEVNKFQEPIISAINEAFPIKYEFKNNYCLFIRQKIIGTSNADTIGYVESFVQLLDNNIDLFEVGFYNFGEKNSISKRNAYSLQEKFPSGSIILSGKNIGNREEKIKIDIDLDGNEEILVPYILQDVPYVGLLKVDGDNYVLKDSYKGEGYNIKDLLVKNIGKEYYIFVGFQIGNNIRKLNILSYKKGKLVNLSNDKSYFYSKMYMKDIDNDGFEELILWVHDTGKAYNINIYNIKRNGIKHTDKCDKIYYKEVVKYYEELLKETKNSSTYLYYLASAFYKIGDYKNVILTVDKALKVEYPYPSLSSLKDLKKKAIKKI